VASQLPPGDGLEARVLTSSPLPEAKLLNPWLVSVGYSLAAFRPVERPSVLSIFHLSRRTTFVIQPSTGLSLCSRGSFGGTEGDAMTLLRKQLQDAQASRKAIGHFNISDLALLKAVFEAARELNMPVMVGLSEGERAFVGTRQIAAFVRSLREEYDFP